MSTADAGASATAPIATPLATDAGAPDASASAEVTEQAQSADGLTLAERAELAKKKTAKPNEDRLANAKAAAERLKEQARARQRSDAEKARFAAENATLKQQLEASRAAEVRLQRLAQLTQDDPYAAMHELGITVDSLAKHGTPEHQFAKMQAETERRIAEAKAETDALKQQIQAEKHERNVSAAKAQIAELVDGGSYPTLATWPKHVVIREVNDLLVAAHEREGEWYPFEDALSHLEATYGTPAGQMPKAGTQKAPTTPNAARPGEDGKKAQRRTLTNQQQAQAASPPPNLANLNQDQRKERIMEMLRARREAQH